MMEEEVGRRKKQQRVMTTGCDDHHRVVRIPRYCGHHLDLLLFLLLAAFQNASHGQRRRGRGGAGGSGVEEIRE